MVAIRCWIIFLRPHVRVGFQVSEWLEGSLFLIVGFYYPHSNVCQSLCRSPVMVFKWIEQDDGRSLKGGARDDGKKSIVELEGLL